MGTGNEARFVLTLDGDAGSLNTVLAAFKKNATSTVSDIERATANVKLFANLDTDLKKAAETVDRTRASVDSLKRSVDLLTAAGEPVGKDLAAGLAQAQKAADAAEKTFIRQSVAVDKLRTTLKASGVDVTNLAAAQAKLAAQAEAAGKAEVERTAKQQLGIKTDAQARAEIAELAKAYNTLSVSGTLSSKELAAAQQQLIKRVAEVKASVTGAAVAAKTGEPDLVGFFKNSALPALGLTATVAGVVAVLKQASETAKAFNQGVAEIGTITNATKQELADLGNGARTLATTLGIDVQAAVKGLFELIRSGVPKENALEVLKISAEAAKAALTDTATGVKAANLLLDNFGADIADLPELFDKIAVGARNGGATLNEFANGAGALLNVARASGRSFDELLTVLTVLVDKSGNAEKSFGDLTKIIARVDTSETRQKLDDLGITSTNLVDIFKELGDRGLSLENVLGLQLAAGGAKSAASLAALTKNAKDLPDVLDKITAAAGTTKKALDQLSETPKDREDRFNAVLKERDIQIGNLVGSSSRLAGVYADVTNALNLLLSGFEKGTVVGTGLDNAVSRWIATLFGVTPAAQAATDATSALTEAQRASRAETQRQEAALKTATAALIDYSAALLADVKALQDAASRNVGDLAARADAEIAALDRSRTALVATAKATLDIRLKLADDQLAIIQKSERDITKAIDTANAARLKLAKDAGESEKKIANDTAQAKIAAISPILAAYQKLYADLISLAQNEAAKSQAFTEARVDIAKKVEDALRQIRFDALTGLDAYVARLAEIDRLVSEGRKKAAEADTAGAKAFFEQAIAASNSLTKVVKEDGTILITTTQAQTDKVTALKKILDASNQSYGDQADAAKAGADKTIAEAERVKASIVDLQGQYDALKKTIEDGLTVKVETDEESVRAALATLDDLTKPRTVVVTVETVNKAGAPVDVPTDGGGDPNTGFARGGLVAAIRRFARGGSVFRSPSWSKVPGAGDGDTVPALLKTGSFVVRKAASRYYGDGLLGALTSSVPHFATGGDVLKPGSVSQRILIGKGKGLLGGTGLEEFRETLDKLFQLKEDSFSLPRSSTGLNMVDWAARIIERFPLYDAKRQENIKGVVDEGFDGWETSIESARRFRVPAVMEFSVAALALKLGAFLAAMNRGGRASNGGTDTVPAMLTPGEYVVSRSAVSRYGAGLMHAINSMVVPRETLAGMLAAPAPAHFATGGPVGAVTVGAKVSTVAGGNTYNLTFNATSIDEKYVRTKLIPTLRAIEKRSE